jgi:hypothetical protein
MLKVGENTAIFLTDRKRFSAMLLMATSSAAIASWRRAPKKKSTRRWACNFIEPELCKAEPHGRESDMLWALERWRNT